MSAAAGGSRLLLPDVRYGPDGLAPAIVQDVADGRVLMLGWVDREALEATLASGEVHFHSRSRARLWRKGETSGNVLRLRGVDLDCDRDALLLTVEPAGPTCHRGTRSCFDAAGVTAQAETGPARGRPPEERSPATVAGTVAAEPEGFAWLETLWATIAERAERRPPGSYTARLLDGGADAVARKVVEEALELALAGKDLGAAAVVGGDRQEARRRVAEEAADLLYHALVALAAARVAPRAVLDVLRERHRSPEGRGHHPTEPPAGA